MPAPAPGQWKRISPYLDQALNLSEQERISWLAALRGTDPDLADELCKLLEKQREVIENDFLEEPAISIRDEGGRAGLNVGPYTLISPIGQGGMSTVWLAERNDGRFQRRVAVKFLSIALYGRGEERFRREGSILGRLAHPHIAQLLDAGISSSGEPYLVLEHVDGMHIDKYCDNRRLNVEERCRLFLNVLGAVAHAHAHLVVHRDIKPSNVLVTDNGEVKLLDFGIAKLLQEEGADAALTRDGASALTPKYAAPEQISGGPITTATDVYALGALLYVLLTGSHPTGSGTLSPAELVKAITETDPPRPSQAIASLQFSAAEARSTSAEKLRRQLRGDIDTILGKTLKKNAGHRYETVGALADDVQRFLDHQPISARPDSLAYITAKFLRRNRIGVTIAALLFLAAIGAASVILVQIREARRQRDAALRELDRANRITDFMTDMFKMSDPTRTRGNTVTAREILDKASKNIDPGLATDPKLKAELMQAMGQVYDNLGLFPTSESLSVRALQTRRTSLGPYARETLESQRMLGWIFQEESRYVEAEKLLRKTFSDDRRTLGVGDPETLTALSNLIGALIGEYRSAEAEKLGVEGLAIAQKTLGPNHPTTISLMVNLAAALYQEGRYKETEKLQRETLDIGGRLFGSRNQVTLHAMENLALTLSQEGRNADAEKLQRDANGIEDHMFGPDHPYPLHSKGTLAMFLKREGRYTEAEKLFRQLLPVDRRVFGPRSRETIENTYNFACAAALNHERNKALEQLRIAIDNGMVPLYDARVIEEDSDLEYLHGDPRFNALIARARKFETTHPPPG